MDNSLQDYLASGKLLNIEGRGYLPDLILPLLDDYDYIYAETREEYYDLIEYIENLNKEMVVVYVTGDTQPELKMLLSVWFDKMDNRDISLLVLGSNNLPSNFSSTFISSSTFTLYTSFGWAHLPSIDQIQLIVDQLPNDVVVVLPEEIGSQITTNKKIVQRYENLENYDKILDCGIDRWGKWLSNEEIFSLQFTLVTKKSQIIYYLMDKETFELLPVKTNFSDEDKRFMLYQLYNLNQNPKLLGFDEENEIFDKLQLYLENLPVSLVATWDPVVLKFYTLCQDDTLILISCILSEPSFLIGNRRDYMEFIKETNLKSLISLAILIFDNL